MTYTYTNPFLNYHPLCAAGQTCPSLAVAQPLWLQPAVWSSFRFRELFANFGESCRPGVLHSHSTVEEKIPEDTLPCLTPLPVKAHIHKCECLPPFCVGVLIVCRRRQRREGVSTSLVTITQTPTGIPVLQVVPVWAVQALLAQPQLQL